MEACVKEHSPCEYRAGQVRPSKEEAEHESQSPGEVDDEDSASAGRGEGGDDAPAADAGPSEHAAAPAPASLARRYLAMPATSASVERLFSVAGQVVSAKRARLDPTTVTLLVFLHEAIPGGIRERGL